MKKNKSTKLVRISPIQHENLKVMAAEQQLSMMWLANDLITAAWHARNMRKK
jgi:predicted HicB family RNase H-like nuclease